MERRTEMEVIQARMSEIWRQIELALKREDWQTYWRLRKSWLSLGRIYSFLVNEEAERVNAQLTLLKDVEGRHHDREVG